MGKFIVRKLKEGMKFDLAAANREIIATSEMYNSKASCMKGIASVVKNAAAASIEDQTVKNFDRLINPKFEIFKDDSGLFRFNLKAKNGQIIVSSEAYKAKVSCKNGIESVKKNAVNAEIVEIETK
ncbi:hypothetical protein SDC9_71013 [bioreactor metagenome]|uniref:DUF1508 domain-containing protein n=1 Tax=bioreactor metagenome TaxID=1076179 RepID=A0A644Y7T7_9ZZZZ|nr:YegP family protein [Candidatus Metalachnospira sp.]